MKRLEVETYIRYCLPQDAVLEEDGAKLQATWDDGIDTLDLVGILDERFGGHQYLYNEADAPSGKQGYEGPITGVLVAGVPLRLVRYRSRTALALSAVDFEAARGCWVEGCRPLDANPVQRILTEQLREKDEAGRSDVHHRLHELAAAVQSSPEELTRAAEYLAAVTGEARPSDVTVPRDRSKRGGLGPAEAHQEKRLMQEALHEIGHVSGLLQVTRALDQNADAAAAEQPSTLAS